MTQIKNISFNNFFNFNDEISLDLSKNCIICGPNNSGKTILLKYINMFLSILFIENYNYKILNPFIQNKQNNAIFNIILQLDENNLIKLFKYIFFTYKDKINIQNLFIRIYNQLNENDINLDKIISFLIKDLKLLDKKEESDTNRFQFKIQFILNINSYLETKIYILDNEDSIPEENDIINIIEDYNINKYELKDKTKNYLIMNLINLLNSNNLIFNYQTFYLSQNRGYLNYFRNSNEYNLINLNEDICELINNNFDKYFELNSFIKKLYNYILQFDPKEEYFYFKNENEIRRNMDEVPGSLINILFILVPLYINQNNKNKIIIVDEIELSLDQNKIDKLQNQMLKINNSARLIYATHNKNILNNNISNIYHINNNKINYFNFSKYSPSEIEIIIEILISVNNKFILISNDEYFLILKCLLKLIYEKNYHKIKIISLKNNKEYENILKINLENIFYFNKEKLDIRNKIGELYKNFEKTKPDINEKLNAEFNENDYLSENQIDDILKKLTNDKNLELNNFINEIKLLLDNFINF